MSEQDRARQLLNYYRKNRFDNQRNYYKKRADQNEQSDTILRLLSGILLLSLGLIPVLQMTIPGEPDSFLSRLWIVLPVAIPAIAAALQTLRTLYQYERNLYLYRQTHSAIGNLSSNLEPNEKDPEIAQNLKTYIDQLEGVIAAENGQWLKGQSEIKVVDNPTNSSGFGSTPSFTPEPFPPYTPPSQPMDSIPPYAPPPSEDIPPYVPEPLPPEQPLDDPGFGDIPDGPTNPPPSERA